MGLFKFFGVVCLVYLGLNAVETVNIVSLTSVNRVFENLENRIQIKSFRRFRVFILCYRANSKRLNDGKFQKLHFSGKLMNEVRLSSA